MKISFENQSLKALLLKQTPSNALYGWPKPFDQSHYLQVKGAYTRKTLEEEEQGTRYILQGVIAAIQ
jgi:hypothetical protein